MKMKVVSVARSEGPLYTVMGEDQVYYVFDSGVVVEASDGKRYAHKTFLVKGYHPAYEYDAGDWAYPSPNRSYKEEVEAFAAKVRARGVIDLRYWEEVFEESSAEREAYNLKCEAEERYS